MKPLHKEKKKKFESAFGTMDLTNNELNKYYASLSKTRSEIKNYEIIFELIKNMHDPKSFNSIKKEYEKKKRKTRKKIKKTK